MNIQAKLLLYFSGTITTAALVINHFFFEYGLLATLKLVAITVPNAILAIGGTFLWRFIWRVFPSLNEFVTPDLNGKYKIVNRSNWPIVDPRSNHTRGEKTSDTNDLEEFAGTVDIKMTLFSLKIVYHPEANDVSRTCSYSLSGNVFRDERDSKFKVAFIYDGRQATQAGTLDDNAYYGAALLTVDSIPDRLLTGHYWTNKNWDRGLNTAGLVNYVPLK